ncbi:MAG TPA: hypothetical protein VJQ82_05595 [Terriglobales bacterium]|nr:hypothetical protein [Terriglobales bacterium]
MSSALKLFTAQEHRENHELNDNDRTDVSQEAQEARGMEHRCAKKHSRFFSALRDQNDLPGSILVARRRLPFSAPDPDSPEVPDVEIAGGISSSSRPLIASVSRLHIDLSSQNGTYGICLPEIPNFVSY